MRRVAAITLCVAGFGAGGVASRADDTSQMSAPDLHALHGKLAFRRAVWAANRDGFQRVVTEFERARAASGGGDVTSLFLLGFSYLRLGRLAEAEPVLRDARSLAPGFPGFVLADALLVTATTTDDPAEARRQADAAIVKYDDFLAKLASYPRQGAFAAELDFLGHLFRGRTNARIGGRHDRAVEDLNAALRIAKDNAEPPAAEVVSLLAQMHQSLDQLDEAKRLVRDAMARDPGEALHYYNLGLLLAGAHEETAARPWFEEALARRPDFPEAHLKLAYVAWKADDPGSMRPHLEAVALSYEGIAKSSTPVEPKVQADLATGFGGYWALVGRRHADAGDEPGSREAFATATTYLRQALAKAPGCVAALNLLLQIGSWTHAPDAEQEELRKRLADTKKPADRETDPFRSTFC